MPPTNNNGRNASGKTVFVVSLRERLMVGLPHVARDKVTLPYNYGKTSSFAV
ncbi:hypothetical protein J6590_001710 [Homalodisca vitripennis]|nr:hypothetical protein J6590_001710 [Homalodisca vitripennis]